MVDEPAENSITEWIAGMKGGDEKSLQRLWERYFDRLIQLARKKIGNSPKACADEQDLVNSVFYSLYRGAEAGRFANLSNRDDLWWLLIAITKKKAADHYRRETARKRGGGQVIQASVLEERAGSGAFLFNQILGREPAPEVVVELDETFGRLLGVLKDDTLRNVALWRMEGYSLQEMADRLGVGVRTVERKLKLIRTVWERELCRYE